METIPGPPPQLAWVTYGLLGVAWPQPKEGEILYNGRPVGNMDGAEWRTFRREVQAIFQDPFEVYNPFYKVDHTLVLSVQKFGLAKSKAEGRELIEQALRTVGLRPDETLGRYPHQLSGGQRQRVMVARALLLKPRIIVADEPVSMVDASLRATILESLKKLHTDFGISFLYITHDLTTAYQISDNIIVLYRGGVAEVGDVDLVIKNPQHPYSQLLISSIPTPDVDDRWDDDDQSLASRAEVRRPVMRGCRFADRCPAVMPMCPETVPPLYRTDDRRAAACFLYRDRPTIGGADMDQVLAPPVRAASAQE